MLSTKHSLSSTALYPNLINIGKTIHVLRLTSQLSSHANSKAIEKLFALMLLILINHTRVFCGENILSIFNKVLRWITTWIRWITTLATLQCNWSFDFISRKYVIIFVSYFAKSVHFVVFEVSNNINNERL